MMPELEAEMRRRAASGVLAASLVAESEALAEWAEQRLVGAHVPKPSSIRRQLAKVYRELKAEKKAVKSADKL
jgi:hypothetical protein